MPKFTKVTLAATGSLLGIIVLASACNAGNAAPAAAPASAPTAAPTR